MKRVFILYEITGFCFKAYDLAVTDDQYQKVMKCQGHYLNGSDWVPECEWLAEFLETYPPVWESDDKFNFYVPYKPEHKYDLMIFTGFIS